MDSIQTVITVENAKISCNFEQAEKAIREVLSEYKGAVFTEDSRAYARKIVAGLRAQKKELQDILREKKKGYMEPWEEFESRAKRLIAMYDEPIDLINGQVKAFEEKRIREKKELIGRIYAEMVPDVLSPYIPLDRIYNARWENATVKEKEIRREIGGITEKTQGDIDTINSMESDSVPGALSVYRKGLDLTRALSHINAYERQKQEILSRKQEQERRTEEERIRREERERLSARQKAEAEKDAAVEQAREEAARAAIGRFIPDTGGEKRIYEYRMLLSEDGRETLEIYMNSVGIEWEMI